ncbi:TPA: hypothetical protein ACH3X2_013220 [Trebouxia sp. C0005]
MLSAKRQRTQAQTVAHTLAQSSSAPPVVQWLIAQTKDLPTVVLHDALSILLQTESTSAQAQAALASCQQKHGYDLLKQVKFMVGKYDPEGDEPRKGGRLRHSDSKLGHLLGKAQQWIAMHRFEAAFQLVWACVKRASDYEERGNDSWSWEKWDTRADNLILQAAEHYQPNWHTVNLEELAVNMQQMQKQADAYGCTIFEKSLPYIKSQVENRQTKGNGMSSNC